MDETIHPKPPELAGLSLEEIARRYTARFRDRTADWDAFADARVEGYRRAQHRFIGAGASGKVDDQNVVPPRAFTLSVMYVPPGQGNAPHTHEVEEVFFVLQGYLNVFLMDESGQRVDIRLGPWECVSCPPGIFRGYVNDSLEPVYFQVILGNAHPDLMGYAEPELQQRRDIPLRDRKV
ncbi:MAG TPA: cupin domain-containing protein [Dehalococcoidia bacterium]|nr:cupin domain-containing protein [Dehalococcoidia bacterium]